MRFVRGALFAGAGVVAADSGDAAEESLFERECEDADRRETRPEKCSCLREEGTRRILYCLGLLAGRLRVWS